MFLNVVSIFVLLYRPKVVSKSITTEPSLTNMKSLYTRIPPQRLQVMAPYTPSKIVKLKAMEFMAFYLKS